LMAVGFAFALLRYRLFDVELVFRRTVLYSVSVMALLAAYLGRVALASLSMARSSASMVGAAVVAGLALGLALVVGRVRETFRTRFLAARGRPGGVAALLADQSRDAEPAKQLAWTIAKALDLRYVAVLSDTGDVVSSHGTEPDEGGIHQLVDDGSGTHLGTLVLGPASGRRLNRRDQSTLLEVLPFVLLVLRAEREAELLRQARRANATSREDERQRLRRDLHDGVGPLLASQLLALDSMRVSRGGEPDADTEEILSLLESQSRAAIAEIRAITRNLRPAVLDTQGLAAALEEEVKRLRVGGLDVDLHMNVRAAKPPGLSAAAEVNILRIVQEALTNVLRHARASSAHVAVTANGQELDVVVDDDGVGIPAAAAAPLAGVGTGSMRQRAEELGGSLTISQGPGGHGTRVHARIPL
jgi:two-component system, NarL family, sensor kinase